MVSFWKLPGKLGAGGGGDEGLEEQQPSLWGFGTSGPALGLACATCTPMLLHGRVQALGGCLLGMRSPRRAAFPPRLGSGATLWPQAKAVFAQGLKP